MQALLYFAFLVLTLLWFKGRRSFKTVDIKAKTHFGKWHYFEIKTDCPKLSIRSALGQILEYSYWPDSEKAEKLIIISDNVPDSDTKKYLTHIRQKFNFPIFYRSFNMEANDLSEDF